MTTIARPLPDGFTLYKGAHKPPNGEFAACLLEAVAYIAGERWSDSPQCVCPVLAAFGRSWNDSLNDEDRKMLLPYAERLIGTRSTPEVEQRRAWMATDWLVREFTPEWLRLAGLNDHAHTLEQLAVLTGPVPARKAQPSIYAAGDAARGAAWDAARAAAWDAARAAARDAARAAAGAAAWDAARAAARDAAWDAAWAAARDAAWDAARAAARAVAWDALQPTAKVLQVSALALMDRMIAIEAA